VSTTPHWLLRNGDVLAAAEVAASPVDRWVGLLGRDSLEGVLVLPRTRAVHTLGLRFPIDVAFLDRSLRVVDLCTMPPWRLGRPRWCALVIEARAGAFERWRLQRGDVLELRPCR
jgi:uncharacterized membrane protein (UPF0127 family)